MPERMNTGARPVLNVMVGLAQRHDAIMALGKPARPVRISDDMVDIDRQRSAGKAGHLRNSRMVALVRRAFALPCHHSSTGLPGLRCTP